MSPSAKRTLLAVAVIIAAIFALRSLTYNSTSSGDGNQQQTEYAAIDIQPKYAPTSRRDARPLASPVRNRDLPTTGVTFRPAHSAPVTLPMSGFMVDDFSGWTTIPGGYSADGIVASGDGITLAGDTGSTAPRNGVLQSPPLPLRHPSLAAPADESAPLPENASISLQISVSEDGQEWSPWLSVDRHARPDGKRIVPPMQATLAKGDLHRMTSKSSTPIDGPAIRYRLGLSASGTTAPVVRDVRVWKRETN